MLAVEGLVAGYGAITVLHGVSFTARPGEVTCLMGRNGAGKTTTLRAVMGLTRATGGRVMLDGVPIQTLAAHQVPGQGIGYVPQGRRLWGEMTVAENLELGLLAGKGGEMEDVLALFPRLEERFGQKARTLSGGEQQMLAVGRALCLNPKVLLLDEPTEGLQPAMIALIRDALVRLKGRGVAVVLVEQRVDAVLAMADQVAFVENGRVAETLARADIAGPEAPVFRRYVGV
jgi:branched-chain amino acid transport system ATP-binding protein